MSLPNLSNNIIQQQNIVINQVPLSHAIMTNVNSNNGIPIATAITHQNNSTDQTNEIKSGIVVETIPIAGTNLVGVQTVPVQGTSPVKAVQSNQLSTESMQVEIYTVTYMFCRTLCQL